MVQRCTTYLTLAVYTTTQLFQHDRIVCFCCCETYITDMRFEINTDTQARCTTATVFIPRLQHVKLVSLDKW